MLFRVSQGHLAPVFGVEPRADEIPNRRTPAFAAGSLLKQHQRRISEEIYPQYRLRELNGHFGNGRI